MRPCIAEFCDRKAVAKGMCDRHYQIARTRAKGPQKRRPSKVKCSLEDCELPVISKSLCVKHYGSHTRNKNKHKPLVRYRNLLSSAKARGHVVELDFEAFCALLSEPCFYCDQALDKSGYNIDRIDPSLGYLAHNCAPCCRKCNYMKLDMTVKEFYSHILKIHKAMIK